MKTNAIVRIILYCLILVVLLGILIFGLSYGLFSGRRSVSFFDEEDFEGTAVSSGTADAGQIRKLSIDWVSGSITIRPGDTDRITYAESGKFDEKYQMVVEESGDKLSIGYCRDNRIPGLGIQGSLRKNLEIVVPREWLCDKLELDVASADVSVTDLTVRKVDFNGASGKCDFENCAVSELDVDTASGDIRFDGTLEELECNAASASFRGVLGNCPSRVSMNSASGSLDLTLPKEASFTLDKSTMSGDFDSDFPTVSKNGKYICGDGNCKIDFNAASGDVTIRQGN